MSSLLDNYLNLFEGAWIKYHHSELVYKLQRINIGLVVARSSVQTGLQFELDDEIVIDNSGDGL